MLPVACVTVFSGQLLILLAMDLTIKIIPVFFVLILSANYFNFIGFWLILRNLPSVQGRSLRKRTKLYFLVMNLLYLLVVALACVPGFQPKCTDKKLYPYVMTWASFLFVINYFFHCFVNCNKEYFLVPLPDVSTVQPGTAINSAETPMLETEKKLDWSCKEHSRIARVEIFRRQMHFY